MKPLGKIASEISPSATLAVDNLAKSMTAQGIDVAGFGAGEPDFNTPDNIKLAAIEAVINNETHYTPAAGTMRLRTAVCRRLKEDIGADYEPSQIIISSGAKHCLYLAMSALLDPGDEVLLPGPYWVSYYEQIRMCHGVPVVVGSTQEEGWRVSPEKLEAAITDKTKCLILNNPCNPTGMMYTRPELEKIADICVRHDLYVISDEIYSCLVYGDAEFCSMVSLGEEIKKRTLLVNGVSKAYAMTGWRIGYIAANAEVAKVISRYMSHSIGNASNIAQAAAAEALEGPQDSVAAMKSMFAARREYILKRIAAIEGLNCHEPEGAFYVFINVTGVLGKKCGGKVLATSADFCEELLKKGLVAVVSGESFGAPGYVRWSYAASMEKIKKGLDRLEEFLATLE
ncbi:MAG: pyridoxal phosphate-dependent aminotransferase [Oscillospiraceae bacterium]|nr:pyridoxal phosphate-dependent aminotransferase [Oscillospiraceae bacterium]